MDIGHPMSLHFNILFGKNIALWVIGACLLKM